MIGLEQLFEQHPLPWHFDDNHPGFEGRLIVWDANKSIGSIVIDLGDMEDCSYADILLAHAIAALPELIACCEAVGRMYTFSDDMNEQIRAALAKAGVKREDVP